MQGSPSKSAAEAPLEPGWVTFPQHPSCQPRVVSQAGLKVRASWKRGCQSRGTHRFRSPPITFTKRVPTGVRSVRPHCVPGGVGTGPQTPGQTGHQGNVAAANSPFLAQLCLRFRKGPGEKHRAQRQRKRGVQRTRQGRDGTQVFPCPLSRPGVQEGPLLASSQGMFKSLPSPSRSYWLKESIVGNSLAVQWLGLHAFTATGVGLIPVGPELTQRALGHSGKTRSLLP